MIVSGGFDSKLVFTSVSESRVYKEIDLKDTFSSISDILKTNFTQPFVLTLSSKHDGSRWLVGLETGNVLEFKGVSKNKPIMCLEGHTTRVVRAEYFEPEPSHILTVSDDLSWALWDSKTTDLIKKIAISSKANWIESMSSGQIVVSDIDGYLHFYEFKE